MRRSNWCGPVNMYDYMAAWQFSILWKLGIRHYHALLDYGCGSLRLGRFMIQYLDPGKYFGIEPERRLVQEGIDFNTLAELVKVKKPTFRFSGDCNLAHFRKVFDYIMAHSVFTHMPKDQIKKTLQSAYKSMKKESIFIVNFHHAKEDYQGSEWTQEIVTYRPQTMNELIQESGLHATPLHLVPNHLQTWLQIRK